MLLEELVAQRGRLIVDGAMGTEMFERGLMPGDAPERMNLDAGEKVQEIHQAYVDAGSDVFLSNSFGGTRYRLALHKLDDRVIEVNQAAGANGRIVADRAERKILVAGSVGPTGELIAPLGPLDYTDAVSAFAEQAEGLSRGGVDVVWIETMSSLVEVEAAVVGTRKSCDLPIAVTMSFDTAGRTMMGVTGEEAAIRLTELGVVAMGANCGNNLPDTEAALAEMRAVSTVPVISKANAGIPQWHGAELSYSGTPEVMGAHAHRVRQGGAEIIGGCCGSTPAHVAFIRGVLDGTIAVPEVQTPDAPTSRRSRPARDGDRSSRRRRG
ncbi:MAG: betaine--homocysteine S-methyltransferase [Acidimicrobiaceae bacterium]|nr:betaine--homocysteine S-methyltransferase [Acidimicrobiaceae bacterium]